MHRDGAAGREDAPIILPVADRSDIRFMHVASAEGQRHSRVAQVTQDGLGFMWFITQDSLQRFDGYRFREFRHDPKNPYGPSGTDTLATFSGSTGKLWLGSDRSLDIYDPVTEKFTQFDPGGEISRRLRGVTFDIDEDRRGNLWIATDYGLIRLYPGSRRAVVYDHRAGDAASLSSSSVRSTFEDREGTLWVGTTEGIDVLDRDSGKVTQHIPLPPSFPRPDPSNPYLYISFCQDHSDALWVSFAYGYGLARIDRNRNKLIFYSLNGHGTDNDLESGVRAMHEDEYGALWLGTTSNGVIKLDRDRKHLERYRQNPANPDSLSADQVNTLYEDKEGNVWVGTNGGWVNRFSPRPLPFRRYRHEIGVPNSLQSDYTSAIYQDSAGKLWIGSMKVLTCIDPATNRYTFYRKSGGDGELSSTWIVSITQDKSGALWFGTIGGGLNRFDPETGKFKSYRHDRADPQSLSHDTVLSLFVDHNGTLWAGTEDGLDRFDPVHQTFKVYRAPTEDQNRYRAIAEDHAGNLWLGTLSSGLHRFDPATGKFTVFQHSPTQPSLSDNQVHSVLIDYEGHVWVGTAAGLSWLDPATGAFITYDERDGMPNSDVNSILQDGHGDLWISTNNGLARFNPRNKTFRNYSVSDGLLGNEFYNYASSCKSRDGELFFNSYAGVIAFYPDDVVDNPYVPPVVLTDFQLFSKSVPVDGNSLLKQSIAVTKSIRLTHAQSIFSFEFSALSYANPERNRYRYKLEELETEWTETDSSRRFVTYTTLPPGDYMFRVQGSNNRGVWNEAGVALEIRVLPAWWNTWWFKALAIVAILTAGWLIYSLRVRAVKERNRELTRLNEELLRSEHELQESERKLAEAQRIAHLGHWDYDLVTEEAAWSEEACRIYGIPPEDRTLTRSRVLSCVPAEDMATFEKALKNISEGADHYEHEHRVRRPNGDVRWVYIHGDVTRDADGKAVKMFGTMQDITERKAAEEEVRRLNAELEQRVAQRTAELAAANKELEAFTSSVSHDLRAPLRHIASFSKILMEDYLAEIPAQAQHFLNRIEKETMRMGQLVDDLLNLSRLGRQEMRFRPITLDVVVRDVIDDLMQDGKDRQVEWKQGALPIVQGDNTLVRQVFVNLLANALKFTRTRAKAIIEIGEMHRDGERILYVRDNGVGFDMRYVDKLFGVFQRLHRAEDFEGTGVGLATVQRIVNKHGGRIWAEAQLNQGATIYFTFGTYL